ncbi:glycosyltransferase family 2 protein [Rhodospirillaceae bacterium SYSU D60014]|uniref:glycosyltransferase family 2 protein n=1 Tax=Virgifigura deserti TaxID=2268457 RepID=UPI000E669BEF
MAAPTLDDYRLLRQRRFGASGAGPAGSRRPKVTLITVALNARPTLERTIASVQGQSFPGFEHVVVDGGSTDGTTELLKERLRPCDYWISEADRGISDAFNKGIALAGGDYVQIINADDWLSPEQVSVAVQGLEETRADFVFGDLIFYRSDRPIFLYLGDPDYRTTIHNRMPALNHPTVLVRRAAFERIGLFDLRYRCAMDYDWFLRLHVAGGRGVHLPGLIGHMTHDGISNTRYVRTIREVEAIAVAHGRHPVAARMEALFRIAKTAMSQRMTAVAAPLYRLVRSRINASYVPIHTVDFRGDGTRPFS